MSSEQLIGRFNAALAKRDLSTEVGLKAAAIVARQAEAENIKCALAGGIAVHLYGYLRATEDVNLLASKTLKLASEQKLSFGGESYLVQVGERQIAVDVIVRNDFFRDFYEAALNDAQAVSDELRVITPEWMLILKFLARRSKDVLDLLWMLREPGLINRERVTQLLEQVMGKTGAQVALRGLEPYYVQAEVMRAGDENGR